MRRRLASTILLVWAVSMASACSKDDPAPSNAPASAAPAGSASAAPGPDRSGPLFHPERATEQAPDQFKVKFTTTKGDFVVQATRAWAPAGVDRFHHLVKIGFYDGVRFHRAVDGFMVQFGLNGDPYVTNVWARSSIPDDPVVKSNKRGFVTFAMAGKNSRTTQIFINYSDKNARLDGMGFAPFGEVVDGMKVVDSLHKGYGELAPKGKGPPPDRIASEGNAFLEKEYPDLDWVKTATVL